MRVVFLGNCADYSPGFLASLARRTQSTSAPISLQAVVCPMRFDSRAKALWFRAKRRVGRAAAQIPDRVTDRLGLPRPGAWQSIERAAAQAGAAMLWPPSMSDPELCRRIAALRADVAIAAGLDRILKEPAFRSFPPIYNIHPSFLPAFRGATPEFWQVDAGLSEGGVTLHRMEAGVDTGAIVLQRRIAIEPWLDAEGLLKRTVAVGIELMHEFLDGYPAIAERALPQQGGSYQPAASAQHREVPFMGTASGVFNRARAAGWSSPLLLYVPRSAWDHGSSTLALTAANAADDHALVLSLYDPIPFSTYSEGPPGEVRRVEAGGVAVTCNPGTVVFRRVVVRPLRSERRPR